MSPSNPAPCAESKIRDHLADNLDLVEDGLVLIKQEEYLPNDKGAAGFVDILARSKTGQLVIIEIKRSDAAARQAIQELAKYAALLKTKKLIKETEYRLVVLSTDWHELLVPFSEFVYATRYACEGRKIVLGNDGLASATETVTPLPPVRTRKFSGRHFIWEFQDKKSAKGSIKIVADYINDVGLHDFIIALVNLKTPVNGISHLLYFAHQQKSFDEYMEIIKSRFSQEEIAEFEDCLSDLTEMEDKIEEAADKAWDATCDEDVLYKLINETYDASCQISHPEKARYWLADERAKSIEIARYGRFDDPSLTDTTIINELSGDEGGSSFRLDMSASIKSKPETDALLAASDNIFFFNQTWRTAIRDLCHYAQGTGADSVRLRAFNNDDILSTLSGLAISYPYFMPTFELEIKKGNSQEMFVGTIEWNGQVATFDEILSDYFEGDGFNYFMYRHFGEQCGINPDLMGELGISYNIARISNDLPEKIRIQGASIVTVEKSKAKSLDDFLEQNEELLEKIANLFLTHDMSFVQLFASLIDEQFFEAEKSLESFSENPQTGKPVYWMSDLHDCNLCERPFETTRFMVDGRIKDGPGACLCALCFKQHGIKIAWGYGQLYEKTEKGWRLIAGGPEELGKKGRNPFPSGI
ncbi:MAG: endonuclease NucS domain-containing protein [Candidatus Brocadiales bacterium]